MNITIHAGSWARRFIPEETRLTLYEGATVSDALAALTLPLDEIGLTVISGKAVPRDCMLRDGDKLEILPMIVGG